MCMLTCKGDYMKLENDIGVWEPKEIVYTASDIPSYSYLVLEGKAQIVSPGGLHLSTIGYNELFGEASFILRKNRTITAIAGENGLTARLIKSDHLIAKLNQDIFLSALVRKLETRLSNSNDKADVLAQGMRDISLEITNFIDRINERSTDGKLLIGKLNGLVEEFEELKMHFGIVD